ncbi:hypothetical protein P5673_033308 [Acropora cervicornis]|uniref:Uncharacterized protein n=1 Tax=Acropora cervicornis TaxID=6130 RepID=A0AAD9UR69_ACRCE|nr:hypothetical protein P5673_033308 [Acropora cervicornis]
MEGWEKHVSMDVCSYPSYLQLPGVVLAVAELINFTGSRFPRIKHGKIMLRCQYNCPSLKSEQVQGTNSYHASRNWVRN